MYEPNSWKLFNQPQTAGTFTHTSATVSETYFVSTSLVRWIHELSSWRAMKQDANYTTDTVQCLLLCLSEAFHSVCSSLPRCRRSDHHLLQHPLRSLPAGWLQLRGLPLSRDSDAGTAAVLPLTYVLNLHVSFSCVFCPGCHLPAPENQPELPAHRHPFSLHLQPARPLQHFPGNTLKIQLWKRRDKTAHGDSLNK